MVKSGFGLKPFCTLKQGFAALAAWPFVACAASDSPLLWNYTTLLERILNETDRLRFAPAATRISISS